MSVAEGSQYALCVRIVLHYYFDSVDCVEASCLQQPTLLPV